MTSTPLCRTLAAALLGAAMALPAAAQAACPEVGSTWLQGDCSPNSNYCEKVVVTGLGWLDGRRAYKFDSYFHTRYGWNYRYSGKQVCY
jgi:hypothetical protein